MKSFIPIIQRYFFAKTPAANDFYAKAFAEGSFVVVSCEKLKTDIQQGQDGRTFVKMQMENPRLEGAMPVSDMGDQQQQQQQGRSQPQQPQQVGGGMLDINKLQQQPMQQQQTQPQYNNPPADFDDGIPF